MEDSAISKMFESLEEVKPFKVDPEVVEKVADALASLMELVIYTSAKIIRDNMRVPPSVVGNVEDLFNDHSMDKIMEKVVSSMAEDTASSMVIFTDGIYRLISMMYEEFGLDKDSIGPTMAAALKHPSFLDSGYEVRPESDLHTRVPLRPAFPWDKSIVGPALFKLVADEVREEM